MSSNSATNTLFDVIVVGGGASGMLAAGRAAARGKRVLLLEKNPVLGKKLAITGGGRCNITNAEFDIHTLLLHYGDAAPFLYSPFAQFGVQSTFDFFTLRGLPLKVEERKRAFPVTERAPDVVRVLQDFLAAGSVTVQCGVTVRGFLFENGRVVGVETNAGVYTGEKYILATGGRSHPETGSTGEGISWVADMGHTTHTPNPDIVPLVAHDAWVRELQGKSLGGARVTFGEGGDRISTEGKILFTHFGLSGPGILNASHAVKKLLTKGPVSVRIDAFPGMDVGALRATVLAYFEQHKNQSLVNALKALMPPGMVPAVLKNAPQVSGDAKVHSITKDERHMLVDAMKALSCTVTGTMGYDWAVVSDGGVDLRDIDTKTMASKKYPNLFFTGDVLHVSRPSGGYSLQLCWTTGWVAGSAV